MLIAGAPGSGKSTLALALAKKLGIHQLIGTDTIREVLRSCINADKCPTLHTSAILACDLAPKGSDKMTWGFERQAIDVKPGIDAVIKRAEKEGKDLILEGIHLLPGLYKIDDNTLHILLTVPDEEQHLKQLIGQGNSRSTYKVDNFRKARAFQDYLSNKAREHDVLIIKNVTLKKTIDDIVLHMP